MNEFVLSFDIGTSSVKAAAVSTDGRLLSAAVRPIRLFTLRPGWNEQDPEELWSACCETARAVTAAQEPGSQLRGIAFGTYWKGIIPVDKEGRLLHRNIPWCDGRAEAQADFLNRELGVSCFNSIAYWPKLLWLKENLPEIYEKADLIHEAGSYLKFRACGKCASDYDNNFITTTEPMVQEVYDKIIDVCGLDRRKFAPLVMPYDPVGTVTKQAAEEMGVPEGTPVFGGTTDMASVATGAGCSLPGQGHLYMGTAGWIGAAIKTDPAYPFFLPYYPGISLAISGFRSAGALYAWALGKFYNDTGIKDIYSVSGKEISTVPAGSRGLLTLPWINGENPPRHPASRAAFLHAEAYHTRADFAASVMESISFSLREARENVYISGFSPYPQIGTVLIPDPEVLRSSETPHFDVIRAVGGCANSDTWMQRTASILNTPIEVPESPQHAAAIGVACCAMIGLGVCDSFADVSRQIRIAKRFEPVPEEAALYDELYTLRKEAEHRLEDVCGRLAGLCPPEKTDG